MPLTDAQRLVILISAVENLLTGLESDMTFYGPDLPVLTNTKRCMNELEEAVRIISEDVS